MTEVGDGAVPSDALSNPDVLHVLFCALGDYDDAFAAVLEVCRAWRAAALEPSLPAWRACSFSRFQQMRGSLAECPSTWELDDLMHLVRTKTCLTSLDLSHATVVAYEPSNFRRLLRALPPSLRSLSLGVGFRMCAKSCMDNGSHLEGAEDLLDATPGVEWCDLRCLDDLRPLPHLERLDLRGLLHRNSLARFRPPESWGLRAADFPRLERLSVGFRLWSHSIPPPFAPWAAGPCQRSQRVLAKLSAPPNLRVIGSHVPPRLLEPVSVRCGVCKVVLYDKLDSYIVGPGQQSHIGYEIYTDVPPKATAIAPTHGDEKRLGCRNGCHARNNNPLWLIDAGSGMVERCGKRYGIACGPAKKGRGPELAIASRHDPQIDRESDTPTDNGGRAPGDTCTYASDAEVLDSLNDELARAARGLDRVLQSVQAA